MNWESVRLAIRLIFTKAVAYMSNIDCNYICLLPFPLFSYLSMFFSVTRPVKNRFQSQGFVIDFFVSLILLLTNDKQIKCKWITGLVTGLVTPPPPQNLLEVFHQACFTQETVVGCVDRPQIFIQHSLQQPILYQPTRLTQWRPSITLTTYHNKRVGEECFYIPSVGHTFQCAEI